MYFVYFAILKTHNELHASSDPSHIYCFVDLRRQLHGRALREDTINEADNPQGPSIV